MNDAPDVVRRSHATLASIARHAGVATSTVSRALNNDQRISPAVRQRIAALAVDAGYTPNALARTLVGGRSGLIGLVLGPMENPFCSQMLQHIVAEVGRRGLCPLLLHVGPGPIEDSTTRALLQYKVDGCLITSAELSSRAMAICATNGVPVVMVNRVARLHGSAVSCDNVAGGAALADFLLAAGHQRFAIITGNIDTSTSVERSDAFAHRVVAGGLDPPVMIKGGASHAAGYAAGRIIADWPTKRRPDAVFGVSDILGMGAMDALRNSGLRVPEDVSVVGFDGIPSAEADPYRLTTLAQPLSAMVVQAVSMLLARIASAGLPDEALLLRGTLTVRSSARRNAS